MSGLFEYTLSRDYFSNCTEPVFNMSIKLLLVYFCHDNNNILLLKASLQLLDFQHIDWLSRAGFSAPDLALL